MGVRLLSVAFPAVDHGGMLEEKLAHLSSARDRYDTILIGSSRTNCQIDPKTFDRTTAELGQPTHTFNFGINGMFAPEDGYVCEQILKVRPPGLRWVLLEVSFFMPSRIADPVQPRRVIMWHDWARTRAACNSLLPPARPAKSGSFSRRVEAWQKRWDAYAKVWPQISGHLRCFAIRESGLGRGAESLQEQLSGTGAAKPSAAAAIASSEGFSPITEAPTREELARFENAYAARQTDPSDYRPLPPAAQANLDHMLARIRAVGATPVLFNAPTPAEIVYVPDAKSHAPVLDFCDFKKYPVLFKIENRQEHAHLNAKGAEIFSKLIAEEWVKATAGQ
jgi:hypothetical protein